MDLTIIVTTIPERRQLLGRCLWYLEHQTSQEFQVLIAHGRKPKGDKLNFAFTLVQTSHLMMLDDDDWLAPHHVASVLPHSEDFVGYDAVEMVNGRYGQINHQETASHICPIRTDLASQVPFGNHYLDDIPWTRTVAPLIETESYIDDVLYFYDKWVTPGEGDAYWSPPRQVGYWPHDKMRENFWWI
jgi:hypothetical protein